MSQTPKDRLNVDPISLEAEQVQPPPLPLPPTPSGPDGVDDVGPTRPIDIPPLPPPVDGDNPPIIYDPSGRVPGEPGYHPKNSFKPGQPPPPVPLVQEVSGQGAPITDVTDVSSINQ